MGHPTQLALFSQSERLRRRGLTSRRKPQVELLRRELGALLGQLARDEHSLRTLDEGHPELSGIRQRLDHFYLEADRVIGALGQEGFLLEDLRYVPGRPGMAEVPLPAFSLASFKDPRRARRQTRA